MSKVAVAISTTGDPHRLELLSRSIANWRAALAERNDWRPNENLFVTIDGDEAACQRVLDSVGYEPVQFYRVGQPIDGDVGFHVPREGHLGVAVNKNTGIELMMDNTDAEHLLLSDDDIWPLKPEAIGLHVSGNLKHSMVCWGYHRLGWTSNGPWAEWTWPRGSMIYTQRLAIEDIGGMVEEFGPGGHEHVEWSRRIHQAGITPALYPSPLEYAHGARTAMGAQDFWYAEDMPKENEGIAGYSVRKKQITSVRRVPADWANIDRLMLELDGDTFYKPYRATDNGRGSATLYHSSRA